MTNGDFLYYKDIKSIVKPNQPSCQTQGHAGEQYKAVARFIYAWPGHLVNRNTCQECTDRILKFLKEEGIEISDTREV